VLFHRVKVAKRSQSQKVPFEGTNNIIYYRDHLPVLVRKQDPPFSVGEKVKVAVEEELLKRIQEEHGEWKPSMTEVSYRLTGTSCIITLA
jgi:hypothetical protein